MEKSLFELWVEDCKRQNMEIWLLKTNPAGVQLYKTIRKALGKDWNYYNTCYFHVWVSGVFHDVFHDFSAANLHYLYCVKVAER